MENRSSLLYSALIFSAILYFLHVMANIFSLYWIYWWYDYMMHFVAGLAGGLSTYWVLFHSGFWRRQTDAILLPVLSVVICLMIVGVAWEIFEYKNGITDAHESYYTLDVIHDLVMDFAGALAAACIGVRETFFRRRSQRNLK